MDSSKIQRGTENPRSNDTTNAKPTSNDSSIPSKDDNCENNGGNNGIQNRGGSGNGTGWPRNAKSPFTSFAGRGRLSLGKGVGNDSGFVKNSSPKISPNKYKRRISFPSGNARSPVPGYELKAGQSTPMNNNVKTAGAAGGGDAPYLGAGVSNPFRKITPEVQRRYLNVNDTSHNVSAAAAGGDNNITVNENRRRSIRLNTTPKPAVRTKHAVRYSRKVFVGGLPPDINEDEISKSFQRFGQLIVDWPHKITTKSEFPPKGYAFLIFHNEHSVQQLIDSCFIGEDKLYQCVSSTAMKDKPVQIRPWRIEDASYILDATMPADPRKTIFVGGVPRPLKADQLAMLMDRLYGGVCYAGIDTDPELQYPKGAARVAFSNKHSYIAAISSRFVQLQYGDIDKRVEVKPYVLGNQMCDECRGQLCGGIPAPLFCTNITCLRYYCEHCWMTMHSRPGREYHKPLLKEAGNRSRVLPFRWR